MKSEDLASRHCVACRGGTPPLSEEEARAWLAGVPLWSLQEGATRLQRRFEFKDFLQAMEFVNRVAEIAEAEGHHPALLTEWGKVTVTWWTHKIKGLHRNDFIMAAKTDPLHRDEAG